MLRIHSNNFSCYYQSVTCFLFFFFFFQSTHKADLLQVWTKWIRAVATNVCVTCIYCLHSNQMLPHNLDVNGLIIGFKMQYELI